MFKTIDYTNLWNRWVRYTQLKKLSYFCCFRVGSRGGTQKKWNIKTKPDPLSEVFLSLSWRRKHRKKPVSECLERPTIKACKKAPKGEYDDVVKTTQFSTWLLRWFYASNDFFFIKSYINKICYVCDMVKSFVIGTSTILVNLYIIYPKLNANWKSDMYRFHKYYTCREYKIK